MNLAATMEFEKLKIKDRKAFVRGKKAILSQIKKQKNNLKKKMKSMGDSVALDPA